MQDIDTQNVDETTQLNTQDNDVEVKDTETKEGTKEGTKEEKNTDIKDPFNTRDKVSTVDLDDEDKEKIGKLVKNEVISSEERINRQVELNTFFQSDFGKKISEKGLEAKVREYAMKDNLMGLKLKNSIYAILGDKALQIGAELEREANTESNNNNVSGSSTVKNTGGKSAFDMTKKEWEKHLMETRKGNLRREEVPTDY